MLECKVNSDNGASVKPGSPNTPNARLATLEALQKGLLAAWLDPLPCKLTIRKLLDENHVPRLKSNPSAKRGGGFVYYSVSAVEKLLKNSMLPGRVESAGVK